MTFGKAKMHKKLNRESSRATICHKKNKSTTTKVSSSWPESLDPIRETSFPLTYILTLQLQSFADNLFWVIAISINFSLNFKVIVIVIVELS